MISMLPAARHSEHLGRHIVFDRLNIRDASLSEGTQREVIKYSLSIFGGALAKERQAGKN
jgi:hypothetical protein